MTQQQHVSRISYNTHALYRWHSTYGVDLSAFCIDISNSVAGAVREVGQARHIKASLLINEQEVTPLAWLDQTANEVFLNPGDTETVVIAARLTPADPWCVPINRSPFPANVGNVDMRHTLAIGSAPLALTIFDAERGKVLVQIKGRYKHSFEQDLDIAFSASSSIAGSS